jgi:excisionase family DNA binding protein
MATIRPEVIGRKTTVRAPKKPLSERLVYTVPEAGRLLGLGRNAAYDAAKRGDIPTLKMGRLLLVPKIPFHRMLGVNAAASTVLEEASNFGAAPDDVEKREKA